MTTVLIVIAIALLLGAGLFFKAANSYGGVKAFLAKELKEERAKLAAHRKRAKTLKKSAQGEMSSATKEVKRAHKEYEKRVGEATATLQGLLDSGSGAKILKLGRVTLYEHKITVKDNSYPLAGLEISTNITPNAAMLTFKFASGAKMVETFDTAWRRESEDKVSRSFSHEQIIQFETLIHNAILQEENFLAELPAMIEHARYVLATETANTHAIDVAEASLKELEQGSQTARDAQAAFEELEEVERKFKSIVEAHLANKEK